MFKAAQFADYVRTDAHRWSKIIKSAGLKVE